MAKTESVQRPHWYFITYYDCPICGKTEEYRERRYDPRPEKWEDRHEIHENNFCWDHFL